LQATPVQILKIIPALSLLLAGAVSAASSADWLREAKYGAFMHLLPSDAKTLALVDDFDVEALAGQLESIGAKYLVLTLGQNSGYFNAPNAVYDRITGYRAGRALLDARSAGRPLAGAERAGHPADALPAVPGARTRIRARRRPSACRRARRTSRSIPPSRKSGPR
jgi:hypothetical protein